MSLSKRPVTLEDLLRLKRTERPPAEFWAEFDRQLRAKQLAALVEKRPWWRSMPHVFSGFRRFQLPLGATAVLALTILTVREYQPKDSTPAAERVATVVHRPHVTVRASAPAEVLPAEAVGAASKIVESTTALAANEPATEPEMQPEAAPAGVARMIPLLGSGTQSPAIDPNATPSARAIAANFAAANAAAPVTSRAILNAPASLEAHAIPVRTPVEPLAQIKPPSETRRARLLAAIATTATYNSAPARNSERLASRVSEERLYDEVHRFGASGNSLSMKF